MSPWGIVAVTAAVVLVLWLAVGYGFFWFAIKRWKKNNDWMMNDAIPKNAGDWADYLPRMRKSAQWIDSQPCEELTTTSYDGLQLYARFFPAYPEEPQRRGKKTVLLFHGYRAFAHSDFCGSMPLLHQWGYDLLLVDQRSHGKSEGEYIGFGALERFDVLRWCQVMNERLGTQQPMVLAGLSMGAATVLMAAGLQLPQNVCGVLADCGFTSPYDILCSVTKNKYHLSPALLVPAVELFSRSLAGYSLKDASTLDAMTHCKVPVLFIHGEADNFVPSWMTQAAYEACPTRKQLFTVPGAGHALSFFKDETGYVQAMKTFLESL